MTRKQRLAALIAALSSPGEHTLAALAQNLRRSPALVSLDLDDLAVAGYPIEGDARSGYRMVRLSLLPPLILTEDELNTLKLAISRLSSPEAASLARLMDLATPDYLPGHDLDNLTTDVPGVSMKACARHLPTLRRAVRLQRWIVLHYTNAKGDVTDRRLHPLGLERWGDAWALVAWCTLRKDFRTFRLDRIARLEVSAETAPHRMGRDLAKCPAPCRCPACAAAVAARPADRVADLG